MLNLDNKGYTETLFALVSQAIKKVMKMDAADPFNVPVDPVALEIPVSMLWLCATHCGFFRLKYTTTLHLLSMSCLSKVALQQRKTALQNRPRGLIKRYLL